MIRTSTQPFTKSSPVPERALRLARARQVFGENVVRDELDLDYGFQQYVEAFRRRQFLTGSIGGVDPVKKQWVYGHLLEWIPWNGHVELLETCTCTCPHCGVTSGPGRKSRMPMELLKRVADRQEIFTDQGTMHVFGGEVLLRSDLPEMLRNFFICSLTTNAATAVTPERSIKLAADLRSAFNDPSRKARATGFQHPSNFIDHPDKGKRIVLAWEQVFSKFDVYQNHWFEYLWLRKDLVNLRLNEPFFVHISLDDIHMSQRSVTAAKIANLILGMRMGFPEANLGFLSVTGHYRDALSSLRSELHGRGYKLEDQKDGFQLESRNGSGDKKHISFTSQGVCRIGRALFLEEEYFSPYPDKYRGKACFGRTNFNDDVGVACNGDLSLTDFFLSDHKPLVFGNISAEGWGDFLRRADKDPLLRALVGSPFGSIEGEDATIILDLCGAFGDDIMASLNAVHHIDPQTIFYWLLSSTERKLFLTYMLLAKYCREGVLHADNQIKDLTPAEMKTLAVRQRQELREQYLAALTPN